MARLWAGSQAAHARLALGAALGLRRVWRHLHFSVRSQRHLQLAERQLRSERYMVLADVLLVALVRMRRLAYGYCEILM